jgi:Protein of unknown function (DUF2490)
LRSEIHSMRTVLFLLLLILSVKTNAQNDRLNDFNNTNWLQCFATIPLNKKWSVHAEYQWRRTDVVKNWQQGLFRTGVNYKLNDHVILHAGYAEAETYAYGNFPIANNGTFPEHRLYEQLTLRQPINKFLFTHRFRIEQRWLGKRKAGTEREMEEWLFLHRFRYQFRTQFSLSKKWYTAAADEIFIGAGKNVGVNIFDQNRIFLLVGCKLNKNISLEGGYFNQTLQQGRRINNSTIVQRNNGIVLSSFFSF